MRVNQVTKAESTDPLVRGGNIHFKFFNTLRLCLPESLLQAAQHLNGHACCKKKQTNKPPLLLQSKRLQH